MKSIPISSLEETGKLEEAIKDWAEGSEALETLLWSCYENGVETGGCHISDYEGYLEFYPNESDEKILKILEKAQEIEDTQLLLSPDGGNPFSGPNWYRADVLIGLESNPEEGFKELNRALTTKEGLNDEKGQVYKEAYKFLKYLDGKESNLNIRARHTKDDKYIFTLEGNKKDDMAYGYISELLRNSEMIFQEDGNRVEWKIESDDAELLVEKMQNVRKVIEEEWDFELPEELKQNMNFKRKALIKRRKFGDTPEGIREMDKWLKETKIKMLGDLYVDKSVMAVNLEDGAKKIEEARNNLIQGEDERINAGKGDKTDG